MGSYVPEERAGKLLEAVTTQTGVKLTREKRKTNWWAGKVDKC